MSGKYYTVGSLWFAEPEVDMLIIQKRKTQRQGQQVEEVVVS